MKKINLRSLKVLILEDDNIYANNLKVLLSRIEIKNIKIACNYQQALDIFRKESFDLLIVDINLGEGKVRGDEFVRKVRQTEINVPILYLTSFFTEESYEMVKDTLPNSFLDKSLGRLELLQAIELGLNKNSISSEPTSLLERFNNDKFFFRIGNIYKAIHPSEIAFFYSKNKTTYAKVQNRNYPTTAALKDLEQGLKNKGFIRTHKTYLINVSFIDQIDLQNNKVHIQDNILPIGYAYRKFFLSSINLFK